MSYCTLPKLIEALRPSQLPDSVPAQTAADLEAHQLNDAIEHASSMVDTYISGRYKTPVAPQGEPPVIPHPIDYWTRDIAAYLATCVWRGSADFTNDDPIYRRFAIAMTGLTNIQNGSGTLNIPPVDSATGGAGVGEPVNPYLGKLFGPEDFDLTTKPTAGVPYPTAWGQERGWW